MTRQRVKFGSRQISLPRSRAARLTIGIALVAGGILGFLPILGFWMVPLGLLILSADVPVVRSWRRRAEVWFGRRVRPVLERAKARWRKDEGSGQTGRHDAE